MHQLRSRELILQHKHHEPKPVLYPAGTLLETTNARQSTHSPWLELRLCVVCKGIAHMVSLKEWSLCLSNYPSPHASNLFPVEVFIFISVIPYWRRWVKVSQWAYEQENTLCPSGTKKQATHHRTLCISFPRIASCGEKSDLGVKICSRTIKEPMFDPFSFPVDLPFRPWVSMHVTDSIMHFREWRTLLLLPWYSCLFVF